MELRLKDFIKRFLPLSKEKRLQLERCAPFLADEDLKTITYLLKVGRIGISFDSLKISEEFSKQQNFPRLQTASDEEDVVQFVIKANKHMREIAKQHAFFEFSRKANNILPSLIAPHIMGMDAIKEVACWQLFSRERFHILLLGDPGTGKTEILRGSALFAPISSFGLGSGTSAVGLSAAKKGKELVKGLLPMAHKGICLIDELNLLHSKDRGALLNAMEKGFVTYDKGGKHEEIDAEVRILATANPKGDRFIGENVKFLKEQMPFDPALLSRFHYVFFVRRPTKEQFLKITKKLASDEADKKINAEDVKFIKEYVVFASKQKVEFNKSLEPVITDVFDDLKSHEDEFLVEFSPRLVIGVIRSAKARARMRLSEKVTKEDIKEVLKAFKMSLLLAPDAIGNKRKK